MSMTVTGNAYSSYAAQNTAKKEAGSSAQQVDANAKNSGVKEPKLSTAAKNLLEKLRKTYGDMDFMVYENGKDAKELLSRGTKQTSVLFSNEELEKMAADEKCEKEYMNRVQGAIRMSEEISKKYGATSAFGADGDKAQINKIGICFHGNGTATYFAELEKSSSQQRERIEKNREERADEKKTDKTKEPVKRTIVKAASSDKLIAEMNAVDWSKIKEEWITQGSRFDYSI